MKELLIRNPTATLLSVDALEGHTGFDGMLSTILFESTETSDKDASTDIRGETCRLYEVLAYNFRRRTEIRETSGWHKTTVINISEEISF